MNFEKLLGSDIEIALGRAGVSLDRAGQAAWNLKRLSENLSQFEQAGLLFRFAPLSDSVLIELADFLIMTDVKRGRAYLTTHIIKIILKKIHNLDCQIHLIRDLQVLTGLSRKQIRPLVSNIKAELEQLHYKTVIKAKKIYLKY